MTSDSPANFLRRGLLKIDAATVLATVDALDLRASTKVSAVVGMPLRGLQQRRDVGAFAASAPLPAVRALMELLAMTPLEKIVETLGENAESPSYEELTAAVDRVLAAGLTDDDVVAVLAYAVGEEFPAAPHCRRLLDEREAWHLPTLPEVAPTGSLLASHEVDPAIREQRRARREEERRRKRSAPSTRPPRPARAKGEKTPPRPSSPATPAEPVTEIERRRQILTPLEQERFRADHPLVGTVVLVEVPFDAVDPETPEQRAKARPALVVAASDSGALVRGVYSNPSPTRTVFSPWRRVGLDHVSYIDDHRVAVAWSESSEVERLGRLTDEEWNAVH